MACARSARGSIYSLPMQPPDAPEPRPPPATRAPLAMRRVIGYARDRLDRGGPVLRAMLWMVAAGAILNLLNAVMRKIAFEIDPVQTMFLRYGAAFVLMLPLVLRSGLAQYRTRDLRGHAWRSALHVCGLVLWFLSLRHLSLADITAIGFTTPIFLMLGAAWMLGEKMVLARWVAAGIGFVGVMIVVAPGLTGSGGFYFLLMLASAPVFAASMLLTKTISRKDGPGVIVFWQAIGVMVFAMPIALPLWQPVNAQVWLLVAVCGVLGNVGHYCLNRSFQKTDISATQSIKFLDLVWASLMGFIFFGDVPTRTTLLGAAVILMSTLWIASREARAAR